MEKLELKISILLLSYMYITKRILIYECDAVIKIVTFLGIWFPAISIYH